MPTLLRMPAVAADATHFVLAAWSVKENDAVQAGDSLAEIETDKAIVELEAEKSGKLARQLVTAGTEVAVGGPIAVLLHDGETDEHIESFLASGGVEAGDLAASRPDRPVGPSTEGESREREASLVLASPVARRLTEVRGLDLASVRGSGPRARVVKKDVDALAATTRESTAAGQGAAQTDTTGVDADFSEMPHSSMRKAIARRLSESKSTIPHFYVNSDCRMNRLLALRAEVNAVAPRKISVNDFVVRAVALALQEIPGVNVGWTESAMRQYSHADIAVAVSTNGGLITPIVRRADTKALYEISEELCHRA